MDFVGELPGSDGFNAILVVTDRFTKMQRYLPARTTWTAEDVANIYITDIWRHYGLPKAITSDRGLQFVSAFLQALNKALDVAYAFPQHTTPRPMAYLSVLFNP